jgi:hypothetical protein
VAKNSAARARHNGSPLHRRLDLLEKRLGTGPTYSLADQHRILAGVPEWLFRGRLLLKGTSLGARCERALDMLKDLEGESLRLAVVGLAPLKAEVLPKVRLDG